MTRLSLNDTDDWHPEHDEQDIRGWPVHHETGADRTAPDEAAPYVQDLIFDTDSERVETIVLDDGTEYPARDIDIGDGIVYLEGMSTAHAEAEPVVEAYGDAQMRRREADAATGFAAHEPAFREHHASTYGETGDEYGHYHPAYRIGYDYGMHEDYRNQDWTDLESEVRRTYEERYGEGTWRQVSDAARHAFEHARAHRAPTT